MPVLQPEEYDISYFDGKLTSLTHNAGYTEYTRWKRRDLGSVDNPRESQDEFFKDIAHEFFKKNFDYTGKKVLEIGCAKGYIVQSLRDLNVDAYGIDVSSYAIGEADDEVKPYLTVADARTHLSTYANNEFDAVFSRWFLCCMSDDDLPNLISEVNRISRFQLHVLMAHPNPDYYNIKTPEEWIALDWDRGTRFVAGHDYSNLMKK